MSDIKPNLNTQTSQIIEILHWKSCSSVAHHQLLLTEHICLVQTEIDFTFTDLKCESNKYNLPNSELAKSMLVTDVGDVVCW